MDNPSGYIQPNKPGVCFQTVLCLWRMTEGHKNLGQASSQLTAVLIQVSGEVTWTRMVAVDMRRQGLEAKPLHPGGDVWAVKVRNGMNQRWLQVLMGASAFRVERPGRKTGVGQVIICWFGTESRINIWQSAPLPCSHLDVGTLELVMPSMEVS